MIFLINVRYVYILGHLTYIFSVRHIYITEPKLNKSGSKIYRFVDLSTCRFTYFLYPLPILDTWELTENYIKIQILERLFELSPRPICPRIFVHLFGLCVCTVPYYPQPDTPITLNCSPIVHLGCDLTNKSFFNLSYFVRCLFGKPMRGFSYRLERISDLDKVQQGNLLRT